MPQDHWPRNGDRVRLTHGDGSTVEGTWRDGTVVEDEGTVHRHTTGPVRRDVIDRVPPGPEGALATAAACYQQVQDVAATLEQLHAAGRLRMNTDPSNTTWTNVDDAVRAALASLDVAVQATAWMEIVPAEHGGGAR